MPVPESLGRLAAEAITNIILGDAEMSEWLGLDGDKVVHSFDDLTVSEREQPKICVFKAQTVRSDSETFGASSTAIVSRVYAVMMTIYLHMEEGQDDMDAKADELCDLTDAMVERIMALSDEGFDEAWSDIQPAEPTTQHELGENWIRTVSVFHCAVNTRPVYAAHLLNSPLCVRFPSWTADVGKNENEKKSLNCPCPPCPAIVSVGCDRR